MKKSQKKAAKKSVPRKNFAIKKPIKKAAKVSPKQVKANALDASQLNELITRGKPKGFVTDLEIMDYFPRIENNPGFLDNIYDELAKANIKVVEVESLIGSVEEVSEAELKNATKIDGPLPDNVQIYLREIG